MSKFSSICSVVLLVFCFSKSALSQSPGVLHDVREGHFDEVKQMTFGGENAEAYWSPDSS